MSDFHTALADICGGHEALRPPNRVSVSQGIAQTLYIKRPGGAAGYWNPDETPYMVEPADMLGSRRHRAVCFVAPAQTGKALDVDTPIPTPNGWARMGDLVAGDARLLAGAQRGQYRIRVSIGARRLKLDPSLEQGHIDRTVLPEHLELGTDRAHAAAIGQHAQRPLFMGHAEEGAALVQGNPAFVPVVLHAQGRIGIQVHACAVAELQ